ncbi:MAG: hypothetical protein UV83_C0006G0023 [candidate division WWE3 bacterium GW2011_GWE2_43_18]|nr:MAG: hypothetical protein UU91_C0008G0036 [candidate division WWE3 bacterium GW2011_GWB1_42_117]KKS54762.1 MAG: hypothetical protein UV21_C0005G0126 [candidate division WWE3 bacterium GW2011_GWD2_42_34]KKT05194.1 MAG: hypothetical protein UV83_C0006G0023 [candidate division WWE3 bacterium GW2011_GWE2_43_18]KKT06461.1 MAG: hypothetical protein UV84_C0007G0023 [candidate division WWE3 bacterium GW2011_GWF2_43_18]KKT08441.1 MAG: hypothetical protein UV87_C0004G0131 [candidate division WWE3 bact
MPEEKNLPTAKARVGMKLKVGGFCIIVGDCPYCHGSHVHLSRETSGNLGSRTAHCDCGEYELVVAE